MKWHYFKIISLLFWSHPKIVQRLFPNIYEKSFLFLCRTDFTMDTIAIVLVKLLSPVNLVVENNTSDGVKFVRFDRRHICQNTFFELYLLCPLHCFLISYLIVSVLLLFPLLNTSIRSEFQLDSLCKIRHVGPTHYRSKSGIEQIGKLCGFAISSKTSV